MNKHINTIRDFILNYVDHNEPIKGLVVGVSGGIDSSVVATICAMTGLPTRLIEMPIGGQSVENSSILINFLKERFPNVSDIRVNLTPQYEAMQMITQLEHIESGEDSYNMKLTLANMQSRLRMITLYAFAQLNRSIVVGTGNKVEDFGIFFYTKYGDGGVDISPIADLMKSEVYEIARLLNLPAELQGAVPTDGLWDGGLTDEDQIGASYDELEWAMVHCESEASDDNVSERGLEVLKIFRARNKAGQHKTTIPVLKIDREFNPKVNLYV